MKEPWNVSGLILEGISGTGKTVLLREILCSERFASKSYLSSIILSEHQTQRILERKEREEGLIISDNLNLLNKHVSTISDLKEGLDQMEWCRRNQTAMRIPYLFERFHFTHVYHYGHMSWADVEDIDRKLRDINCKAVILKADRQSLAERILSGRDKNWMSYISRFGGNDEEIIDHFMSQQSKLLGLAELSGMEKLILDTGSKSVKDLSEMVLNFWNID